MPSRRTSRPYGLLAGVAAARERAEREGLSPEVAEAVWRAMIGAFVEYELTEHRRRG